VHSRRENRGLVRSQTIALLCQNKWASAVSINKPRAYNIHHAKQPTKILYNMDAPCCGFPGLTLRAPTCGFPLYLTHALLVLSPLLAFFSFLSFLSPLPSICSIFSYFNFRSPCRPARTHQDETLTDISLERLCCPPGTCEAFCMFLTSIAKPPAAPP
jgi:hypothetical protein